MADATALERVLKRDRAITALGLAAIAALAWSYTIFIASMGGGDMAIYQAVEAFRLFHGVMADSDRMRRHFAQLAKT